MEDEGRRVGGMYEQKPDARMVDERMEEQSQCDKSMSLTAISNA
jgi:hypothetical protein